MSRKNEDPRYQIVEYLKGKEVLAGRRLKIIIGGPNSYFSIAALDALLNFEKVATFSGMNELQATWAAQTDYVVIAAHEPYDDIDLLEQLNQLEIANSFKIVSIFKRKLSIFGMNFDYSKSPHDMSYPLPRLYLLQPKLAT